MANNIWLQVQCYRELRMKDMGGAQQAYRITVRQLESMIRLSEGLARLHLDDEVRPEYVLYILVCLQDYFCVSILRINFNMYFIF